MPDTFMTIDANFPQFTQEQKESDKFKIIIDYLFMLKEHLNYTLYNLDSNNFNETGLKKLSSGITESLEISVKSNSGDIASLSANAGLLEASINAVATTATEHTTALSELDISTSALGSSITLLSQYSGKSAIETVALLADLEDEEIDNTKIYYVTETEKYYEYDEDTETWEETTPIFQSLENLNTSIAQVQTSANDTSAEVSLMAMYNGYDNVLTVDSLEDMTELTTVYYYDGKYWLYNFDNETWEDSTTLDMSSAEFILKAINNRSTAKLSADKIDFVGKHISFSVSQSGATYKNAITLSDNGVSGSTLIIDTTNCSLTASGILKTVSGEFSGKVSATTGEIGGWTIGSNALYTANNALYLGNTGIPAAIGGINRSGLVFKAGSNYGVSSTGTLYTNDIVMTGGSISWASVTPPSYSQIPGTVGVDKPPYNADNTNATIEAGQHTYIDAYGLYTGTITANSITAGTMSAERINVDNISLGLTYQSINFPNPFLNTGIKVGYGSTVPDAINTRGAMMFSDSTDGTEENFFIATESGVRMTAAKTITAMSVYCTATGIYSTASITVSSDRNIKNSINYMLSDYDNFFMDLKPCFFKYNNDIKGTVYGGFIAQDVEQSLIDNNLDLNGFNALSKQEKEKADGTKEYEYGIRYTEFIPLNTHMIQKAYKKIYELEQRIALLERENI